MKEQNIFQKLFSGGTVATVGVTHSIDKKSIATLCVCLLGVAVLVILTVKILK